MFDLEPYHRIEYFLKDLRETLEGGGGGYTLLELTPTTGGYSYGKTFEELKSYITAPLVLKMTTNSYSGSKTTYLVVTQVIDNDTSITLNCIGDNMDPEAVGNEIHAVKLVATGAVMAVDDIRKLYPQGGGGELPAVTSADNGKILIVANGEWAVGELPVAAGVNY